MAQIEVVTLRKELDASRQEAKLLSAENARLASTVSQMTTENAKLTSIVHQTLEVISRVKSEMSKVRTELEAFRQLAVTSQGADD